MPIPLRLILRQIRLGLPREIEGRAASSTFIGAGEPL
jgi:hypothetical protein